MDERIRIVSPFENYNFFSMVVFDNSVYWRKFQARINYDLNVAGFDRNDELIKLILNNITLFRNNVLENYDKIQNIKGKDTVIKRWNLNEMPFEKAKKIYLEHKDYFDRYFDYFHSGWLCLRSRKTNPSNSEIINSSNICQRLYVSIDSDCIDSFVRELQTLFEKNNLPYDFKIQCEQKMQTADCICIYSDSSDRTRSYLDIMFPLVEKYKNSIHKPQPHLGIINDQIGLGFQLKHGYSYSEIMEEVAFKAFEKSCNNIYECNKGARLRDNRIDEAYEDGNLNRYIKNAARGNLTMFNWLYGEFEDNFRSIIENEYPDFDIDMCDVMSELNLKKGK